MQVLVGSAQWSDWIGLFAKSNKVVAIDKALRSNVMNCGEGMHLGLYASMSRALRPRSIIKPLRYSLHAFPAIVTADFCFVAQAGDTNSDSNTKVSLHLIDTEHLNTKHLTIYPPQEFKNMLGSFYCLSCSACASITKISSLLYGEPALLASTFKVRAVICSPTMRKYDLEPQPKLVFINLNLIIFIYTNAPCDG
jgi:hypothetical protein